jgi:hypothetical protein
MTTKAPRIPRGCDQQGRYPQAAEPCTELGQDDDLTAADVGGIALLLILAAVLTVITVGLGMFFAG